jgi:hypothetical protein
MTRGIELPSFSKSTSKESLGGCCITPVSQEEINSLPAGIYGSVKKPLPSFDVDIRLIQPPTPVCPSQVPTAALIHFRTEHLNPSPNAAGRNCKSTLGCHLGHVRQRNRVAQIPPNAPQNNVATIVTPFKWIRCCDGQHLPYQPALANFRNGTKTGVEESAN